MRAAYDDSLSTAGQKKIFEQLSRLRRGRRGAPMDTKEAPGTSSSSKGEKRTKTQENVPVKKRLLMISPKRAAKPDSPPDDPVKRRLLKKTDLQSSDVLMAVEMNDKNLLHTVNTF